MGLMRLKPIPLVALTLLLLASNRTDGQSNPQSATLQPSAPIEFSAYAITPAGQRSPLRSGTVDSQPGPETDILLAGPDSHLWTRRIPLPVGFDLSVHYSDLVNSLSISLDAQSEAERGLGYNAFGYEGDGVYTAHQGGARIRVSDVDGDRDERTIEFLDDVTLSFRKLTPEPGPGGEIPTSHEVILRAGSLLRVVHGTDKGPIG